MPFHQHNGLRYYSFDIFENSIKHGVFTRQGGVSSAPWASLNVGGMVGDEPARVRENRVRLFEALGRAPASIFDVWLVHSADVICADAPRPLESTPQQADVILTDKPQITLFMRFADCVPILFHDPKKAVVGIAHAGWLGTVRGAVKSAVETMQARYGCRPQDILAAIGPSIGPDHYEIGPDVTERVRQAFGADADRLLETRSGRVYLDLWTANSLQLQKTGIARIEMAGICTACHVDDWFSHRAEKGRTGRFGALMGLQT